jgi:hypothetical protein
MKKIKKIFAVPGWMCKMDFDYELGQAYGGTTVHPSLEDLKDRRKCVEHCGTQQVRVLSEKDFQYLLKKSGVSDEYVVDSSVGPVIWTKELGFVNSEVAAKDV